MKYAKPLVSFLACFPFMYCTQMSCADSLYENKSLIMRDFSADERECSYSYKVSKKEITPIGVNKKH